MSRAAHTGMEKPEPSAQRWQAFSVLRELLTRIAQRHTLVLFIDDLHWADADSMLLLEAVLRPPDPPPVLMLACLRAEEIASKPFLQAFLDGGEARHRTTLWLDPMTEEETLDLLASMIPPCAQIDETERVALAREAGGSPFLLEQLAHYAAGHNASGSYAGTLADMLQHRLQDSPGDARQFLEVLAVCGRPMPQDVVREAAGLAGDERPLVAILRSEHLLRHSGDASRIEMYHDRLRETLATQLSPDRTRNIHRRLVRTLTTRGCDDAEELFEHYRGAGDGEGAARQAAIAANKANAVLAFDRAAYFYRSALRLSPGAHTAAEWQQGLAEALANAGRSPEAGDAYLEASTGAQGWRQVDLQRRAAEQFLIGGHIDRGMTVIRTVLRALRMRREPGPLMALVSLSWRRARIRRRGFAFVSRAEHSIPADTSAAYRYLLVRDHRAFDGRQHSCGGFQRPPSDACPRCRRTVPNCARPCPRGRVPDEQWQRRSACHRVREADRLSREAIGPPARCGAVVAHRRHVGVPGGGMEAGSAAVRARARRAAGVPGRRLGNELCRKLLSLCTALSGRDWRCVASAAGAADGCQGSRQPLFRDRAAHAIQCRVAGRRPA